MSQSPYVSGWWDGYRHALPASYTQFIIAEANATLQEHYGCLLIPGLLQTERYARAITEKTVLYNIPSMVIEKMIAVRLTRQWQLFEASSIQMRFLIDESTLHRQFGELDVRREQLAHLLEVADHERVELQVIPYEAALKYFFLQSDFLILESGDTSTPPRVYIDDIVSGVRIVDEAAYVAAFQAAFRQLRLVSLDEHQSRAFIKKEIAQLEKEIQTDSSWRHTADGL